MGLERKRTAADFFAGIGLVSLGLKRAGWTVEYAVDYSDEKRTMYEAHFGEGHFHVKDVGSVAASEVPSVSLYHASFPCTDLSLAGARNGIDSGESSSFWGFSRLLDEALVKPPLVLIENVEGLLSSAEGMDLFRVLSVLNRNGYLVDLLLIDASHFVPQSRTRLFIVGRLSGHRQDDLQQETILLREHAARPRKVADYIRAHPEIKWCLYDLPDLPVRTQTLEDIVDPEEEWWPHERSQYLFSQMFERHKEVITHRMSEPRWWYGTVFRRMRQRDGAKRSTAELRYDGIAGCLRTPKGGSARQILVRAGHGRCDARLLSARECARLMGAAEYQIASQTTLNQALFGFGDAVCVPVVEWLARNYLGPALDSCIDTRVETLVGESSVNYAA